MKKLLGLFLALSLGACSSTAQTNFKNAVNNFNTDVVLVDGAIANLSTTLYANCNGISATAQALLAFTGSSGTAGESLVAANAAISSYCQASQVTNIPTAVQASAAAYSAAKAALAAAKAGN